MANLYVRFIRVDGFQDPLIPVDGFQDPPPIVRSPFNIAQIPPENLGLDTNLTQQVNNASAQAFNWQTQNLPKPNPEGFIPKPEVVQVKKKEEGSPFLEEQKESKTPERVQKEFEKMHFPPSKKKD